MKHEFLTYTSVYAKRIKKVIAKLTFDLEIKRRNFTGSLLLLVNITINLSFIALSVKYCKKEKCENKMYTYRPVRPYTVYHITYIYISYNHIPVDT